MAQQEAAIDMPAGAPKPDAETELSLGRRMRPWWLLTVITILYLASLIDRGGLPILVPSIKADLGLSDVQMSLLLGFSLTLVQIVLLLPTGYLVDRFNRRKIIGYSVILWSSISALTGFVGGFGTLYLARSGLATAEVGMHPASISVIRDAFPPERRGIVFSIFGATSNVAGALGLLVSGALITAGDHGYFQSWPIIGHFKTWQLVLAVPGICSFPLVLLILTIREPARRASQIMTSDVVTTREAASYIWNHRWAYVPFIIAVSAAVLPVGALTWMPTALNRGWGYSTAEIARYLGGVGLVATLTGTMIGGWLMDRLARMKVPAGPLRVFVCANAVGGACNVSVLHTHQAWQVFALLGLGLFFNAIQHSTNPLTVAYLTPSRLMGRAYTLYYLSFALLTAPSATLVALTAKYFYNGPLALVSALNTYLAVVVILGQVLTLFAISRVSRFGRMYPEGTG